MRRAFDAGWSALEVHDFVGGSVNGFNGVTEGALDSVALEETLWLPREDQLRAVLGHDFVVRHVGHPDERQHLVWLAGRQQGRRQLQRVGGHHVVVGEGPEDHHDGVDLADAAQEPVAHALAGGRSRHQAGDVDELQGGADHLLGLAHLGQVLRRDRRAVGEVERRTVRADEELRHRQVLLRPADRVRVAAGQHQHGPRVGRPDPAQQGRPDAHPLKLRLHRHPAQWPRLAPDRHGHAVDDRIRQAARSLRSRRITSDASCR